jgi:LPXTG-motif cell wall-anchored protein
MYGGQGGGAVLGATTTGAGAATIAALPNTGGSRSVIANVAMLSIAVGLAVLVTTAVRFVAKRHYNV